MKIDFKHRSNLYISSLVIGQTKNRTWPKLFK